MKLFFDVYVTLYSNQVRHNASDSPQTKKYREKDHSKKTHINRGVGRNAGK